MESEQLQLIQSGLAAHQQGNLQAAITYYQKALEQRPSVDGYANLGVALRMEGHIEAAILAYQKALAFEPNHTASLSNLGGAYRAQGKLSKAIPILSQAISINSDFAAAHYNLGLVWMDAGEPEKAISCFERVLQLEPNRVDAPFDRATCLLQTGDLLKGFAAYECRFAYEPRLIKSYQQPRWDGSSLKDKTLLLYTEQGFGDTLQFIRYVALIKKEAGSQIVLECPANLKSLMQGVPGIDYVITPGDPLPAFDTHCSILSLPYLFKTTLAAIPADIPYLVTPKNSKQRTVTGKNRAYKVGFVWASGHQDIGVRNRTIPLEQWLELFETPNVQFYSLQKGPQAKQLDRLGLSGLITDLAPHIQNFGDTAAILDELDLLISADTAIVHLAGALNKPVWVLLPYGTEWRWMLKRDDSPWYPSIRLFRQSKEQNWGALMTNITQKLRQYSSWARQASD